MKYLLVLFLLICGSIMSANQQEENTINFYNQNSKTWIAQYGINSTQPTKWIDELGAFQGYLTHGKILDVGFGGGRESRWFIDNGYDCSGVDASIEFVSYMNQQFPQHSFKHGSVYKIPFQDSTFDGIWCSAVLLHIPHDKTLVALKEMYRVLKPGSIIFITVTKGDGEIKHHSGRYFFLHQPEPFYTLLEQAGFIIEKTNIIDTCDAEPWQREWITVFAKKSKGEK